MEKQSWTCTLLTQAFMCFALFIAFKIGGSHRSSITTRMESRSSSSSRRTIDLYFLSVRGGHRPLNQHTLLLKQMDKVAKLCDVKFVVNISELGDDDPLIQNGTLQFSSLKVPWYGTNASQGPKRQYFLKKISLNDGQILDIIVVDTGVLQGLNGTGTDQFQWLTRMLENTDSNWRIVIGFDPLVICNEHGEQKETRLFEPLHSLFLKFGVNAYLSKQGCANLYARKDGIAFVGNPGPSFEEIYKASSSYRTLSRELHQGFFLHRVSPLEIVSYFINAASEVEFRSILHQQGTESM